jgi:hypothetical protein
MESNQAFTNIDCKLTMASLRDAVRKNDKMYAAFLFTTLKECLERRKHSDSKEDDVRQTDYDEISAFLYHISVVLYPNDAAFELGRELTNSIVMSKTREVCYTLGESLRTLFSRILGKFYKLESSSVALFATSLNDWYIRFSFGSSEELYFHQIPFSPLTHYLYVRVIFKHTTTNSFEESTRGIHEYIMNSIKYLSMGVYVKASHTKAKLAADYPNYPRYEVPPSGFSISDFEGYLRNFLSLLIVNSQKATKTYLKTLRSIEKSNKAYLAKVNISANETGEVTENYS